MTNFNEDAIREAAYYIWKNNGCQANSSSNDWNSALNQLSACAALSNARKKPAANASIAMAKVAVAATAKKSSATSSKKMPQIILTSKK